MVPFDGNCAPEPDLDLAGPSAPLEIEDLTVLDRLRDSEGTGRGFFRDLDASRDGTLGGSAGGGIEDFLSEAVSRFSVGMPTTTADCLVEILEANCGSMLVRRESLDLCFSIVTVSPTIFAYSLAQPFKFWKAFSFFILHRQETFC